MTADCFVAMTLAAMSPALPGLASGAEGLISAVPAGTIFEFIADTPAAPSGVDTWLAGYPQITTLRVGKASLGQTSKVPWGCRVIQDNLGFAHLGKKGEKARLLANEIVQGGFFELRGDSNDSLKTGEINRLALRSERGEEFSIECSGVEQTTWTISIFGFGAAPYLSLYRPTAGRVELLLKAFRLARPE